MRFTFFTWSLSALIFAGCTPAMKQQATTSTIEVPSETSVTQEVATHATTHHPNKAHLERSFKMPETPKHALMGAPMLPDFEKMPQMDPGQFKQHDLITPGEGKFSSMPPGLPPLPPGAGNPFEHGVPELPGAPHSQHFQISAPQPQGIPHGVPDVTMFKPGNLGVTGIPHGVMPISPNLGADAVQALGTQDNPAWKHLQKPLPQPPATGNAAANAK